MMGNQDQMELMANMGANMLSSGKFDRFLRIYVTNENEILTRVKACHRAMGIEMIGEIPDPEDRVEEIRNSILARFKGSFPKWWVAEYFEPAPDAPGSAKRASEYADLADHTWHEVKQKFAAADDDDDPAGYVDDAWGVSLQEFEELVVRWPDGRESQAMHEIIAGPSELARRGLFEIEARIRAGEIE